MQALNTWWDSLTTSLQIYYGIAILASFFLILQLLFMLIGIGDSDADIDHDFDADGDAVDGDIKFLSTKAIVAFFLGFGWVGVIGLKIGLGQIISLLLAGIVGFICMYSIFSIMRAMLKLTESGNISLHNAIGETGNVYLPLPANKSGSGIIQIKIQDRLREFKALTNSSKKLPNNAKVRVIDIIDDSTLLVEPIEY